MKKAAEYRDHAAQCRNLAAQMDGPEHREQLLEMAETWEKMAGRREAHARESASAPQEPGEPAGEP